MASIGWARHTWKGLHLSPPHPPTHTNLPCRYRAAPSSPFCPPPEVVPVDEVHTRVRYILRLLWSCVCVGAHAYASLDSVVISGSIGDASSLYKGERGRGEGRKRTVQEIDNHRTFNYFLNAATELSHRDGSWDGRGIWERVSMPHCAWILRTSVLCRLSFS